MEYKNKKIIENDGLGISHIWHKLLIKNRISKTGIVVEVAPGYEPKIGSALAMFGFKGTLYLVEPEQNTANEIAEIYKNILPEAKIKIINKSLHEVAVGYDVPIDIDLLVASHPFDDMVISHIAHRTDLFPQERSDGELLSIEMEKFYDNLTDEDYENGIENTVRTWRYFIEKLKPKFFIASQYPSHTLIVKGLKKRQESGFIVLNKLKGLYRNLLIECDFRDTFDFKGDPKWWIIVQKQSSIGLIFSRKPDAISRLGENIFVKQDVRRLKNSEYEIVYVDREYFKELDDEVIRRQISNLAVVIDDSVNDSKKMTAYADKQKDNTNIGLNGNLGSGRAVYYGDRFNIMGVGKTSLCKSLTSSHNNGQLEMIGAMRRIILSKWLNYFAKRAPEHIALIALKNNVKRKWNSNEIPASLLIRIDEGTLDRPSHIEQSPEILIDFNKTLDEYAKLDAEYFAFRFMLGAWSTSNYSLSGHTIDLESASFTKHRSPYYTSSSKYLPNKFGYEGVGFINILHQLATVKDIDTSNVENDFYSKRREYLALYFLMLLGIEIDIAKTALFRYFNQVVGLSDMFERLARKTSANKDNLSLYKPISETDDPALLDMSNLFRNISRIYESPSRTENAYKYLIRKTALDKITNKTSNEAREFIKDLFILLDLIRSEGYLSNRGIWDKQLQFINQDLLPMYDLNKILIDLCEKYRQKKISPETLGIEIDRLCKLPESKLVSRI